MCFQSLSKHSGIGEGRIVTHKRKEIQMFSYSNYSYGLASFVPYKKHTRASGSITPKTVKIKVLGVDGET